ncbi:MAG: helix-turn-helix domain-containing protein [Ectothiorhodospiraceae bacterium]|nr:helix-turn-helix domain-containing protein [Ectothiorhodospiraceae bacterium]MCH8502893.1 helix-turn-helix domain-containing protein [Ectothiorhodospiraceae bacterium]
MTRAIDQVGLLELAKVLGVSYQAVRKFERTGCPPRRVLDVVRATSGEVTPFELSPEMYPDPDWLPPDLQAQKHHAA